MEENKDAITSGEIKGETLKGELLDTTNQNRDWALQYFAGMANKFGLNFTLTIQVGGLFVVGTLISGREYFDRLASIMKKTFEAFPDAVVALEQDLLTISEPYNFDPDAPAQPKDFQPEYIHLKDALIYMPSGLASERSENVSLIWRGKLESVDGFVMPQAIPKQGLTEEPK
jgi:hypothetical protein